MKRLWTLSSYLRVRDEDEDLLVVFQLLLEPDAGLQVQVVGGLVEQQQVRLDEQRPEKDQICFKCLNDKCLIFSPGERHPHPPPAGELLALLVHHGLREAEAPQQAGGLHLGAVRPQLVQPLVHLQA